MVLRFFENQISVASSHQQQMVLGHAEMLKLQFTVAREETTMKTKMVLVDGDTIHKLMLWYVKLFATVVMSLLAMRWQSVNMTQATGENP